MSKIIKIIILIGIFTLPIINSRITQLLGFSFGIPVNGNFEFTKVMFFNVWSALVIGLFYLKNVFSEEKLQISNRGLYSFLFLYVALIASSLFSVSPYVSFLGNEVKGHSLIMWSNLIGLYIVLSQLYTKQFFSRILNTFILSGIFVAVLGLKEYFDPTFDYGNLGNRLFSTFGHPNYMSVFLLSFFPFLYSFIFNTGTNKKNKLFTKLVYPVVTLLFITTLVLTKSVLALGLFGVFNVYFFYNKFKNRLSMSNKKILLLSIFFIFLIFSLGIFKYFPEKLHSFVSRFFIWEATIKVIFSDIRTFFVGGGLETFRYVFDTYKSEYLYIFENLGFTADRPHNILLNFFYHFGILGFSAIVYLYYFIVSKIFRSKQNNSSVVSLILILLFLFFNPTSVVIYLIVMLLLVKTLSSDTISLQKNNYSTAERGSIFGILLVIFVLTFVSVCGAIFSIKFFISERSYYKDNISTSIEYFPYKSTNYFYSSDFEKGLFYSKIKTQEYFHSKLYFEENSKAEVCNDFIDNYNFVETYFHCGDIFWDSGEKELARKYYKQGLYLLPDLWNKQSPYYAKPLIKYFGITGHRYLSEKYGLDKILKRVDLIK